MERDDLADVSTDEEDFDHSQERQEVEDNAAIASIVTWNCQHAAPASGENTHKLRRTIDLLEDELGGLPDAIALQETLFKDEARLSFAQKATAEYTWLCSPGKKRVQECNPTVDPGRGSWLLIRKGGPLDGGCVLDLSEWDDQHRVVAVRTALGLLVAYYGPACTNAAQRGDGARYFTSFSSFLKEYKDELLAVVGDLNMIFDPFDLARPGEHGELVPCQSSQRGDLADARAMLVLGLSTRGGTTIHMHASTVGRTRAFRLTSRTAAGPAWIMSSCPPAASKRPRPPSSPRSSRTRKGAVATTYPFV